ncbi:MAG: tyrosine-protein phosphatase [Bullifex sp.]
MKKTLSFITIILMVFMLFTSVSCATKAPSAEAVQEVKLVSGVSEIQKYGNLVLTLSADELKAAGFEYGDVVAFYLDGQLITAPFCTNYSDVEVGKLVLRDAGGSLILAINMGDFATYYGIAVKEKYADGTYTWIFPEGKSLEDVSLTLQMHKKEGYRDEYLIHQLTRTNERADYSSDEVFANFREVKGGDLGAGALYRSSSPVNNEIARASYADKFVSACGVKTVMNLADNDDMIKGYIAAEDFASPYYRSLFEEGGVKALNLGVDFKAEEFKAGIAEGLRFLSSHEGPYLVHCNEGKDRAGFTSALLGALMGSSYDELVKDYMETYLNYYHVEEGSDQYNAVKTSNIDTILQLIAGVGKDADLFSVDLRSGAEAYVKSIGLTDAEIASLRANLSRNY